MGRKSKRRRENSSVSSPHTNMSNTPPPSMSNLTYAVQNANETLWATTCNPSYVYKCVSNKFKHGNATRTTNANIDPNTQHFCTVERTAHTCEWTRSRTHEYTNNNNKSRYGV